MTADAFRDANAAWLLAMEKELEKIDADEVGFPGVKVTWFPSNGIERMYNEVSSAQTVPIVVGYLLMLIFVTASQWSSERHLNLALVGFVGFWFVVLANVTAGGLVCLAGIKFNPAMLQALPFLALGLGVDDLFLLLHAFKTVMSEHKGRAAPVIVALTLTEAGSSVTITSACNCAVFGISAASLPIIALQHLLGAAALIVLLNWVTAITLIPALLSVWASLYESAELKGETIQQALTATAAIREEREVKARVGYSPSALCARFYHFLSESQPMKIVFFLFGLAMLVSFASLIPSVEYGYKMTDLARKNSYLGRGINDVYDQIFSQHTAETVVFGVGIDYETDQAQVLRTHRLMKESKWSAYNTPWGRAGANANTWLENLYADPAICPHFNAYDDRTDPWWAFYEDFHLWRKPQQTLLPRAPLRLAFGGLYAQLLDRVNSWPYTYAEGTVSEDVYYSPANKIVLSWDEVELNMQLLQTTDAKLQMIKDFKAITDASGLNIYMYGQMFVSMEQFISLERYYWQALAASMAVVFVVSLSMGISWLGACLVSCFSIFLALEVYGALYAFSISFQNYACTSMLISIGVAVEFVAHPVTA